MSFYNRLYGVNSLANFLLKILDIDQPNNKWKSGRFRDIHLNEDGTKIILFTRNGGGNRECWREYWYEEVYECNLDKPETICPGCVIEKHLPKHPNYLTDYDDEFDYTYAYVEFSVPEKFMEITKKLATGKEPKSLRERFMETCAEIEGMSKEDLEKDQRFKPFVEIMKKITEQ